MSDNKKFIKGFRAHRLKEEDPYHAAEVELNIKFNQMMQQNGDKLLQMVYGNEIHGKYLDDEQIKLMFTVIQWLGTPVGKGFMRKCGFIYYEELGHELRCNRMELYDKLAMREGPSNDDIRKMLKIE